CAAAVRPDHSAQQWRPLAFQPHHRNLPLPVRHPAHESGLRRRGERAAVHRLRGRRAGLSARPVQGGAKLMSITTTKRRRPAVSPLHWLTLFVVAAFVIVPFYTTALGGFKEIGELRVNPFGLPASWDPVRFVEILGGPRYFSSL